MTVLALNFLACAIFVDSPAGFLVVRTSNAVDGKTCDVSTHEVRARPCDLLVGVFVRGDPSGCVLSLFIAATLKSPVLSGDSIEKIGQLFGGMCRILSEYIASGGVECYPHMASGRLELRGLDSFDLRRG